MYYTVCFTCILIFVTDTKAVHIQTTPFEPKKKQGVKVTITIRKENSQELPEKRTNTPRVHRNRSKRPT